MIAEALNADSSSKDKGTNGENPSGPRLLDGDTMLANRTVVVPSPQMHNPKMIDRDEFFTYGAFPQRFVDEHFETEFIARRALLERRKQHSAVITSALRSQIFIF